MSQELKDWIGLVTATITIVLTVAIVMATFTKDFCGDDNNHPARFDHETALVLR